jgi:hypothetical protein
VEQGSEAREERQRLTLNAMPGSAKAREVGQRRIKGGGARPERMKTVTVMSIR